MTIRITACRVFMNNIKTASKTETILGFSGNVYCSENNLYLTSLNYKDNKEQTQIYKYSLKYSKLVAKGAVEGTVLNQFSMDESNGYFRIAVTIGGYYKTLNSSTSSEILNNVYILDKDLKITGSLINLAKDERIYSVRFMRGRMLGNDSFDSGDYIEESYDIKNNGVRMGKIIVGYFGIYNFSEKDVVFKNALYKSFVISMGIAIIIAVIISLITSNQLTKPLSIINKKSLEIRKGNFKERGDIKTNTIEIQELSDSINYLAESLDKQDALRKRLTSDMAHEIRTPLTTLQNSMEAMMDGVISMNKERIESCYEEVIRLNKLVDNLRNIESLEESNLNLNKTRFDIKEELERICRDFQLYFKNKNINFISNIKESREVLLDKDKFRQIVYNLLSNAYRYSNDNGEVKLSEYIDNDFIVIKVADNGIGISEEELPLIFERFYRSDKSRDRETGGAGIGLTITKALVEAHGGKIKAESEVDLGSCFTVILPAE